MVLAACATPTAPPAVTVVVTEIVEQPGATQVVEKVITATPAPEMPAEGGGPILAEGLVPCQPMPELPTGVSLSGAASPAIVSDVPKGPSKTFVANPFQQAGGVYRVGVFEDVTTTNYWAANGPDNTVWNSYMLPQRLALINQTDKFFTLVPWAAAEMPGPLTQEGETWTVEIPLRQDIMWSDGTPFTAKDVAFTAATALKFGLISGNWVSWYDPAFLQGIEAVDDFTAKIIYHTKPGLARHEYGTLQGPILQEAFWAPKVAEAAAGIDALGENPAEDALTAAQAEATNALFAIDPSGEPTAGGFTLSQWEKGAFLENSKYADFFETGNEVTQWGNAAYSDSGGTTAGTPEGDPSVTYTIGPNVDSVVYTYYGSQDAAILAMKNGEVDFVINPLGLQRGLADQVRTDPNLTVIENSVNGYRYMSFNTRRRPMNDCAFRQAMAVLIDKEFVTGTILQGVAFPFYSFVAEGNAFWYNPDAPKIGEGLDRETRTNLAREILKQAGYTWEGGQEPTWDAENRQVTQAGRLLMPDGTPVPPLNMPAPSPGYDPLRSTFAIWIETWANEFGIPLTADLAGFNVIVPIIFTEQAFDMYILGWSLDIFPSSLRDFFACDQAVPDGNNAGGYCNEEFDAMAQELLTCDTIDGCKEIAFSLQSILAEELPYVLLFDTGIIEAFRSASVEYPWTEQLSGLQYSHQTHSMQNYTTVK
jgi:ABC-type transport system substrate-binding protein